MGPSRRMHLPDGHDAGSALLPPSRAGLVEVPDPCRPSIHLREQRAPRRRRDRCARAECRHGRPRGPSEPEELSHRAPAVSLRPAPGCEWGTHGRGGAYRTRFRAGVPPDPTDDLRRLRRPRLRTPVQDHLSAVWIHAGLLGPVSPRGAPLCRAASRPAATSVALTVLHATPTAPPRTPPDDRPSGRTALPRAGGPFAD